MLFILIPLLFTALLFLKPFRKLIFYCAKNIAPVIFFVILSFVCSIFGFTIPVNVFSLAAAFLFGLPGISLALFLSLII